MIKLKLLQDNRGETLVEVLASVVVATLSISLLFGCIMVSTQMDAKARAADEQHYENLTAADAQASASLAEEAPAFVPGIVTITRTDPAPGAAETDPVATPSVMIYGDDGMYSYVYKGAGS